MYNTTVVNSMMKMTICMRKYDSSIVLIRNVYIQMNTTNLLWSGHIHQLSTYSSTHLHVSYCNMGDGLQMVFSDTIIHFRKNCLKFGHPKWLTDNMYWTNHLYWPVLVWSIHNFATVHRTFNKYWKWYAWMQKKKLKNFMNSILLSFTSTSISYADTVINP